GHVKLVEAQEPRLLRDRCCRQPDRILAVGRAELDLTAKLAHAIMHVAHELVEVRAPLALDRARSEKQVHQHGLAAADIAVEAEAAERLVRACARTNQPAQRRRLARQPMLAQPRLEPRQQIEHVLLGSVALDLAGGKQAFVLRSYVSGHPDGRETKCWANID